MGGGLASWKANTSTILLGARLENPGQEALRNKPLQGSGCAPLLLAVSREKGKSHQVFPNLVATSDHEMVIHYLAQTVVTLPCPCHKWGTTDLRGGEVMLWRLKRSSIPPLPLKVFHLGITFAWL